MKKSTRILLLLLLLLIPLAVTACGGDDPDATTTEKPTALGIPFSYRTDPGVESGTYDCGRVIDGRAVYEKSAPTKEGYALVGLYNDEGELIIDDLGNCIGDFARNEMLTCRWASAECSLFLEVMNADNEVVRTYNIPIGYGEALPALPIPNIKGYEGFRGWYMQYRYGDEGSRVTDNGGYATDQYERFTVDRFPAVMNDKKPGTVYLVTYLEGTKYNLTLHYNDGSGTIIESHFFHSCEPYTIKKPDTCKEGREIYAWSTSPTELIIPELLTEDATLYAHWRPCRTVTLHNGYGETDSYVHVNGDRPLTLPQEAQNHYTFGGWYTSADFSENTKVSSTTAIPLADAVSDYYRKLNPITYTAVFYSNGTTACDTINFTVEDEHLALPTPTKQNYVFKGWTDFEGSYTPIFELHRTGGNRSLYAVWEGAPRLFVYEGQESRDIETTYGSSYYIPPLTPPSGMLFGGWKDESGTILTDAQGYSLSPCKATAEITEITPVFLEAHTLTVETEMPSISKIVGNATSLIADGTAYTVTVAFLSTRDCGYEFIGFYDGDTLLSTEMTYTGIMPERDLTVTARFAPKSYEVTLKTEGLYYCDTDGTEMLTYNAIAALPIPFKEGYAFLGWAEEDSGKLMTDAYGVSPAPWSYIGRLTLVPTFEQSANAAFPVYNTKTLLAIRQNPSIRYVLIKDIDMSGVEWTPFAFSGVLDGGGHAIENLTVTTEGGNAGMFTTVSGTVKNLTFKNLSVTSTAYEAAQVGGVCGQLTASGTLSGITVESGCIKNNGYGTSGGALNGNISSITSTLGGLVGLSDGSIIDCESRAAVISTCPIEGFAVGGIAGFIRGGLIERVENRGQVTNATAHTGGIAGACWYTAALHGAQNFADVSGTSYVGGVFGHLNHHMGEGYQVANLKNHGAVTGDTVVGGIIGEFKLYWEKRFSTTFYINAFENTGNVTARAGSGVAAVGGICGRVDSTSYYWGGNDLILAMNALNNSGAVTSNGGTGVGGYIGHFKPTQSYCTFTGCNQSGTVSAGGTTLDVGNEIGKTEG